MMSEEPMRLSLLLILAGTLFGAGCASSKEPTTRPANTRQRQDAALRDPFDYKPEMGEQDISGGNLGHLDRGGMRRDMDHVLNP
jgi:hypothetical protein